MFYECSSLKRLNLINFNTDNVTNMSYMFGGCTALSKLKKISLIKKLNM